jgi:hypothetical protein
MLVAMTSALPPLQAGWMTQLLGGAIPEETRATCRDCAMCSDVSPGAASFNPRTKCCTFMPILCNHLVGRALDDDDPAGEVGRSSLRARIAAGVGVTPLALGRPPSYLLLYQHGSPKGFGQSLALRCPHYVEEGGLCGIWRHREAVCATWFCKHVRGQVGLHFWQTVRTLLSVIEADLARWCLVELGLEASALEAMLPVTRSDGVTLSAAEVDGRSDRAVAEAVWGSWAGREEELYRACGRLVATLGFDDVLRLCGPEARLRAAIVRAAWQKLRSDEVPPQLRPGKLTVVRSGPAICRVTTYSQHDPIEMHRALLDVLHHFDGRPTEEVLAAIEQEGRMRLGPELVRQMADFAVLVSGPPDDGP